MPQGFRVDDEWRPIVVVRFSGKLSDREFVDYLRALDQSLAQHKPTVLIFDARRAQPVSASQRRMQTDWLAAHEGELKGCLFGMAFVIASPIVRAGLTAVFWVKPLPCPHAVVATVGEAWSWASARCVEARLPAPPMLPASES